MTVALTLQSYLGDHHVAYDVARHEATATASHSAEAVHVPGEKMAKGVVLKSGGGYVLAVLPASRHIEMEAVARLCGSPVRLATEAEAAMLFPDCEPGAVPVFGEAYRIPAVMEEELDRCAEIWCEGGDHRSLLHMDGGDFRRLMRGAERGHFVH
jgi:Ala-tRNA(Pro) deacylase